MLNPERELSKEQLKVVYEGEGPCLVLSGPGSGKTKTLVYRAAYLIKKGVPPSKILLLTFTKKAAKEMLSRIKLLAGREGERVCGGTFHHVGNLYLKEYAKEVGYSPGFVIFDEEDSRNLLSIILKEKGRSGLVKAPVVQKIISLSVNSQTTIEETLDEFFPYLDEGVKELTEEIAREYEKRKKKCNVVDYDDLLLKWNEILSLSEIGKKISSDFSYILVDEYQDTNLLQDKIVEKLSAVNRNIMVVGDDAQSIYSFRAANIRNILDFPKKYEGVKIFKLETNYRSTPEILEAANRLIVNNTEKLEKKLRPALSPGKEPAIRDFSTPYEQARFVVDMVERRDPSQVAVLFRAHYQAIELEMELVKRGVPYALRGGPRFFEKFHVKDLLAFLRVALNYRDEASWYRLLTRLEGVGDVHARKIIETLSRYNNLEEIFLQKKKISDSLSRVPAQGLLAFLDALEKVDKEKIEDSIATFMDDFYSKYLEYNFENAKERKSDLKRIRELADSYSTIEEMLDDFSLSEDYREEESGVVTLSSIHQAKGLEWETVFIISLREGNFPHNKSLEEGMLEEERRLLYVAITRCKKELFLTYPRYDAKDKNFSYPSIFLREIKGEDHLIEEVDEDIDDDGWEYF